MLVGSDGVVFAFRVEFVLYLNVSTWILLILKLAGFEPVQVEIVLKSGFIFILEQYHYVFLHKALEGVHVDEEPNRHDFMRVMGVIHFNSILFITQHKVLLILMVDVLDELGNSQVRIDEDWLRLFIDGESVHVSKFVS